MSRIVIAGGGLAGGLAALALARRRPEVELLVIDQGADFGGNHTWSFFDTDIPPDTRWVLDGIDAVRWTDHEIRFPRRRRTIPIGYNSIRSAALDAALKGSLRPAQYRLGTEIAGFGPTEVQLANGETIAADAVIDARGPGPMPGQQLGWQKFVGRLYRFPTPHKVARPIIMDATVPQHDGYRFVYYLPMSATQVLIEDTYYSAGAALDRDALRQRLEQAAAALGAGEPAVEDEEHGVLPVVMGGDFDALWPNSDPIPRLGLRGGFFHPTTSYSLPDAAANAAWLAAQTDYSAAALTTGLRARGAKMWRERGFYRLLNRMLFRAAEPDQSYRVLEHFYRLPPGPIARFYAGRLTAFDKLRVLTGKPPVPIGRALSAIFREAA
ncbi:lycopene beta-cyclase CrtY [Sphingomonas lutea]|uniref:lycopene beta-cyclase CrtY n=1 Tax=Sphingomonas lutea TaxID=1045317 RepID=UPI001CB6F6DC|nr:lycopene beta-cyclase CrtY [Sphingomonas lutea]